MTVNNATNPETLNLQFEVLLADLKAKIHNVLHERDSADRIGTTRGWPPFALRGTPGCRSVRNSHATICSSDSPDLRRSARWLAESNDSTRIMVALPSRHSRFQAADIRRRSSGERRHVSISRTGSSV